MANSSMTLIQSYQPGTFQERGVWVPFTTPLLSGARARSAPHGGSELVVANPAGGRGCYVLPWSRVREFCRPTVHDTKLYEAVASQGEVTPASMRLAARRIAAQGFAGHAAAAAARCALEAHNRERTAAGAQLLAALVRELGFTPPPLDLPASPGDGRHALTRAATALGRTPDILAGRLAALSEILCGLGSQDSTPGRMAREIEALADLQCETAQWASAHTDESGPLADMVAKLAELTVTCARRTLREAQGALLSVADLVRRWETAPLAIAELVTRPDWLLDGWQPIVLLWRHAGSDAAARRTALADMADMVPVLPRQVAAWVRMAVDTDAVMRFRKTVALGDKRPESSGVQALIARNEEFRALAA